MGHPSRKTGAQPARPRAACVPALRGCLSCMLGRRRGTSARAESPATPRSTNSARVLLCAALFLLLFVISRAFVFGFGFYFRGDTLPRFLFADNRPNDKT